LTKKFQEVGLDISLLTTKEMLFKKFVYKLYRKTDQLSSPGSPNIFVRRPHKLLHNSSRVGHLT